MDPHFPTKQETAVCHLKGEKTMGNDLVGQSVEAMKKFRPNKTVMKIWNKKDLCIILAVTDPANWEMEMDPYYVYANGKVDGVSYIDNVNVLSKVMKPEYLVYTNKEIS